MVSIITTEQLTTVMLDARIKKQTVHLFFEIPSLMCNTNKEIITI